jgi:uroporphyrinogen-III synthase
MTLQKGLRTAGFDPVFFPVIEIRPIENNVALERASQIGLL